MINMYNMDCMKAMAKTTDKYYDLAIVDPVYGHNITGEHNQENGWGKKKFWDKASRKWNTIKTDDNYFKELFRISKNQIIWGGNYFTPNLPSSEAWIIWDKGQRKFSLADAELAFTSFEKATRIFNYSRSLSNFKDNRIHPTQKPIALYKWLLKNYAKEGWKIFDSHGGSGSICIACYDLGFNLDWYELDSEYYDAAKKRFDNHCKQLTFQLEQIC